VINVTSNEGDVLNDLWIYNGQNWTLLSGFNASNLGFLETTKGGFSSANYPPARSDHALWIDPITNTVYIFGGASNGELSSLFFSV
jgi:hypothetical protein